MVGCILRDSPVVSVSPADFSHVFRGCNGYIVVCCCRLLPVEFSNSIEDPADRLLRGHLHKARREPTNSFRFLARGPLVRVTKGTQVQAQQGRNWPRAVVISIQQLCWASLRLESQTASVCRKCLERATPLPNALWVSGRPACWEWSELQPRKVADRLLTPVIHIQYRHWC